MRTELKSKWTAEVLRRMEELIGLELTASQIQGKINREFPKINVSRNAVIGRCHRNGWRIRRHIEKKLAADKRKEVSHDTIVQFLEFKARRNKPGKVIQVEHKEDADRTGVPMMKIGPHRCRWFLPNGNMCGEHTAGSYCSQHGKHVYVRK